VAETADLTRLESTLRDRLLPDGVAVDTSPYVLDGLTPALAAFPSTAGEVASVLAAADEARAAVVPWGSGSHQGLGMPLSRYDLALDLRRLNRVVEYEPADLTVTVEAGIELDELQRVLAERGQWLPLSPPREPHATLGGALSINASGPDRYRYGTARDLLIGVTFALPNGELVKSGGRVVKNVAGYDLGKLQIGALGTLGVLAQATLKVAPLPARTEMAQVDGPLPILMSITTAAIDRLLAIQGLLLYRPAEATSWRLQVLLAGGAAAVARSLKDLSSIAADARLREPDQELSGPSLLDLISGPVVARASLIPTVLPSVCEALAAQGASVAAYPAAGIAYASWTDAGSVDVGRLRSLRRQCVETGRGALVLERAPLALKRRFDVWGEPPSSFELMRRLKSELDPNHILNPGRYLGGI
jgi:glycolate oxidase FAD binding subunit